MHAEAWLGLAQWDWRVCAYAAGGGHLVVLQYARQHGRAWRAETCTEVANAGHLAILRLAHEGGCPWNEDTTQAALVSRRLTCTCGLAEMAAQAVSQWKYFEVLVSALYMVQALPISLT